MHTSKLEQNLVTLFEKKSFAWKDQNLRLSLLPSELNRIFDQEIGNSQNFVTSAISGHLKKFSIIQSTHAAEKWFVTLTQLVDVILHDKNQQLKPALQAALNRSYPIDEICKSLSLSPVAVALRGAYLEFLLQDVNPVVRAQYSDTFNKLQQRLCSSATTIIDKTQPLIEKATSSKAMLYSKLAGFGFGLLFSILALPITLLIACWKVYREGSKITNLTHYLTGGLDSLPTDKKSNFFQGFRIGLLLPTWPFALAANFLSFNQYNKPFSLTKQEHARPINPVESVQAIIRKQQTEPKLPVAKQGLSFVSDYFANKYCSYSTFAKLTVCQDNSVSDKGTEPKQRYISSLSMSMLFIQLSDIVDMLANFDILLGVI